MAIRFKYRAALLGLRRLLGCGGGSYLFPRGVPDSRGRGMDFMATGRHCQLQEWVTA